MIFNLCQEKVSNNRYVSIVKHGPDLLKVHHHVHNKARTVSVSRLATPDQQTFPTKYVPTGIIIQIFQIDCYCLVSENHDVA